MRIRVERAGDAVVLGWSPDGEPASWACVEEDATVVALRPVLARDSGRVRLEPLPRRPFRFVLRREGRPGARAVTTPWITAHDDAQPGSIPLPDRGAVDLDLEPCDPGLVVDAVAHVGDAAPHALLRAETGAPNQLVFLAAQASATFGRSVVERSRAAHWIWRWLPCRDERDPAWRRNRSISRHAGDVVLDAAGLTLANPTGRPDDLRLDDASIERDRTLLPPWTGGRLEVSGGRFALALRTTSRSARPLIYVPPGSAWEGGEDGFGVRAAYESVVLERLEGWPHHRYVLLASSVLVGSAEPAALRLEGPGIRPVHAQLLRLGRRVFVCGVAEDARIEVDGKRVRPRHLHPLSVGARVAFGEAAFRFLRAHEDEMKGFGAHTEPGPAPLDRLAVGDLHRAQAALSAFRHSLCNELLNNLRGLASLWRARATDESFRARFLAVLDRDVIDREIRRLVGTALSDGTTVRDVLRELCRDLSRRAERLARAVEATRRVLLDDAGAHDGAELVQRSDELLRSVQWLEDALAGRRISVRRAAERARDVLLARAVAAAEDIELRFDPGLRDGVFGEPRELDNALVELLRNALRHGAGGPVVVALESLGGRRGGVRLAVESSGSGLDAERVARFVEAGSRAGSYGLVHVRAVIEERHGGTLHLAPNARGGLTVTIELVRQAT